MVACLCCRKDVRRRADRSRCPPNILSHHLLRVDRELLVGIHRHENSSCVGLEHHTEQSQLERWLFPLACTLENSRFRRECAHIDAFAHVADLEVLEDVLLGEVPHLDHVIDPKISCKCDIANRVTTLLHDGGLVPQLALVLESRPSC